MDFPSSLMHHWDELLQQAILVLGNFSKGALSGLKQMCSWTWSNQGSHNPMGSAAFSCLTCTSRFQLEFGSLHNTAAAAAGLQHFIPLLATESVPTGKPCCTRSGMVSLVGGWSREEQRLLLLCLWILEVGAAGTRWDKGLESDHKNGLGWNPFLSVSWKGFSLLLLSISKWHAFLQQYMLIGAFKSLAAQFYYS